MQLFLNEHGEALLYGIIGTLTVALIGVVLVTKWKTITPVYNVAISSDSSSFANANKDKHPSIQVGDIIYADYNDASFDVSQHIKAKDWDDKDITSNVKTYGQVDVSKKGIYRVKCLVTNDYSMVCTKYVSVMVE